MRRNKGTGNESERVTKKTTERERERKRECDARRERREI